MGGFLSFVKKEALHILRDKRTMLIVLLLPIVQILCSVSLYRPK